MGRTLLTHGAEQQPIKAAEPSASHHEKRGTLCCLGKHLRRMALNDRRPDLERMVGANDVVDHILERLACDIGRALGGWKALKPRVLIGDMPGMHNFEACPDELRVSDCPAQSLLGLFGGVHPDYDAPFAGVSAVRLLISLGRLRHLDDPPVFVRQLFWVDWLCK